MLEITPEIIAAFRAAYPKFSNTTTWPDSIVEQALCYADAETGSSGWGVYDDECHNFKQRGMFLWAAHWLTVMYPNGGDGSESGSGGGSGGPTSSKQVRDESASFAINAVDVGSDKQWLGATGFGQQFLQLKRRAGMGARVV